VPTSEQALREAVVSIETDAGFTEARLKLRDGSILYFRHRVGERWVKAVGPGGGDGGCSAALMDAMRMFRLNAKHLDVEFEDGSRWEWKP
jgi:hypothetical protein